MRRGQEDEVGEIAARVVKASVGQQRLPRCSLTPPGSGFSPREALGEDFVSKHLS